MSEAFETKSPAAERILKSLRSTYIEATLEFTDYVLGDLTGLNTLFQSDAFRLHRLLPEVERVIRMFCQNFMVRETVQLGKIDVDDQSKWLPLDKVYSGLLATERVKTMMPYQRESFFTRCRDWYRVAVRQILQRIDVSSPILEALKDVNHNAILKGTAEIKSTGSLASKLPRQLSECGAQVIDRQWRSVLIDNEVKNVGWEKKSIAEFWKAMAEIEAYKELAMFFLEIMYCCCRKNIF